jgi:hypothetical protein
VTRFEEALLTDLKTMVDQQKSSPPRARRRPTLVAAAIGAGTALGVGLLLAPSGQSPAYALEREPDGTFRLAVYQVSGIDDANKKLAAEGIRAHVYRLRSPGSCPQFHLGDRPDAPSHLRDHGDSDENWFYLPRDIPQDVTLVLTVSTIDSVDDTLVVSSSAIRGEAPPCVERRRPSTSKATPSADPRESNADPGSQPSWNAQP